MSITTHILDLAAGRPAAGVAIRLVGPGDILRTGVTDHDGRCRTLLAPGELIPGDWRLEFDIGAYRRATGGRTDGAEECEPFYPRALVEFTVRDAAQHHHIPLLLSPYGYSTYRGS